MVKWVLLAVLAAGPVAAQAWKMRPGDEMLAPDDLRARLAGQVLEYYDGGVSEYRADGKYTYTYGGGGTWYGYWDVPEAGLVCVRFLNDTARCDRVVVSDGRWVVLTREGARFPVR